MILSSVNQTNIVIGGILVLNLLHLREVSCSELVVLHELASKLDILFGRQFFNHFWDDVSFLVEKFAQKQSFALLSKSAAKNYQVERIQEIKVEYDVTCFNISFLREMFLCKLKKPLFLWFNIENPYAFSEEFFSNTTESLNNILSVCQ